MKLKSKTILTIVGYAAALLAFGANLVRDFVDDKKQEEEINDLVAKEVTRQLTVPVTPVNTEEEP